MDAVTVGVVAVVCYWIGSFSFSRTAVRLLAPGKDIENIQLEITGTGKSMRYSTIGGSAAGIILGKKTGMAVGILDMLKVIVPVAALRLLFPTQPIFMMIGTVASTVGHMFPAFYHLKGGGGYSTIFGGLLIINPLGAILCSLSGMLIGLFVFRSFALLYALQFLLLIPWMALRFGETSYIVFAVIVNLLFFISWIPTAWATLSAGKPDHPLTMREQMEQYPMGAGIIRMLEKIHYRVD